MRSDKSKIGYINPVSATRVLAHFLDYRYGVIIFKFILSHIICLAD